MIDAKVLGRCAGVAALAAAFALPAAGQTPARDEARQPSRNLGTENRAVINQDYPRRYEVYDPGAGYGGNLYLNDQYFLRGTTQGETPAEANRSGMLARPRQADAGEQVDREPAARLERVRAETVRVQPAEATDDRPAGLELVIRVDGEERSVWLADRAFAEDHVPSLSPGDAVTVTTQAGDSSGDGADRQVVARVIETAAGRVELPYYRFGQAVEAKLVSTRTEPAEGDRPAAVVGKLELSDGRTIDAGLGPVDQLEAWGVTPREGAAVRIEGFLRSTPERGWSFIVEDLKVDGQSLRKPAGKEERPDGTGAEPAE